MFAIQIYVSCLDVANIPILRSLLLLIWFYCIKAMSSLFLSLCIRFIQIQSISLNAIVWKKSDAVVIIGFGFGKDDEHINGILRTLVDVDDKKIIVVALESTQNDIAKKLKIRKADNIRVINVNQSGFTSNNQSWIAALTTE